MSGDYRDRVKAEILDDRFVRATLSSPAPGQSTPWSKVVLRPVQVKGRRRIQAASFDERRCITKNYAPGDTGHLDDVLAHGFQDIHVETTAGSMHVRIGKGGKARVHTGAPSAARTPDLSHNREKRLILPADCPDPFLQAVGIMTKDGAVKADKQRKFRQINEFLAVIDQTLRHATTRGGDAADSARGGDAAANPISVVDCGCGNAYLTFAAYHYFRHVRDMPARMVGIDVNADLIVAREATARELGWTGLSFEATPIADYTPATAPDMVLALHACDTATDDALAQAIKWRSEVILCAPCCHHHLQQQLAGQRATPAFRPLLRHGLLRERLGDVITDAFRALILRIMGYQTDVIEFVSTEHTPRNVMIRAVKTTPPGDRAFVQEYNDLKAAWQVTPYLEEALGEEFATLLGQLEGIGDELM